MRSSSPLPHSRSVFAALLGLYALAASAVGLCDDAGTCVERLLPQRQVFEPSPERHDLYQDLFQVYRNVSRKLLADFDELAEINHKYATKTDT